MASDDEMNVSQSTTHSDGFDPDRDARVLMENLRLIGGDNQSIVEIVSSRTHAERLEIVRRYKEINKKDLIDDLKTYTHFDFQRVLIACFMHPIQYDAWSLHQALEDFGTDEKSLVEILISRTNSEIQEIRNVYRKTYDHDVDALIIKKTSGEFCDMLLMLATPSRDESDTVELDLAKRDAKALARAIRKGGAIQNYAFNDLFCRRNFAYLRATFDAYKKSTTKDIYDDIKEEFHGHIKSGLKAIAEYARNPIEYFAHRLYRTMKGLGTDDSSLTRIIVTRSEVDMPQIKQAFQARYGDTLERFIAGDTSFSYKNVLLGLVSSKKREKD